MHKYNSITTLDFTSIQLYNIVIDVESYPLFLPWCLSSKIVSKVNKNNFDASLTVGYKAIDEKYKSIQVANLPLIISNFHVVGGSWHRLLHDECL